MRGHLAPIALAAVAACANPVATDPSAVAGAASTPPPPARGSFEGCTGVFTAVFGWAFTCDTTSLVTREGDEIAPLLRGARESMRGAFAGPVEERTDDVVVAGAARHGVALSLRTARRDLVAVGTAAILEAEGHPARVVACLAGADAVSQDRCKLQLDALATVPYAELPPQGVRIRARAEPAIAGRSITSPPDCHLAANDRTGLLDCGDAVLGWSEPSDPRAVASERDLAIEDTARKLSGSSAPSRTGKRTSAPCQIEGVASTCTLVRWPEVTLLLGSAAARGHTVLVWCVARDASTSHVCADSISTAAGPAPVRPRGAPTHDR